MVIRGSNVEIHWDLVKGKVEIRTNSSANSGIARSSTRGEERYENQTNHFFACVNNQCKPICTVRDGIEVIELIEKAKEMYSRGEKK